MKFTNKKKKTVSKARMMTKNQTRKRKLYFFKIENKRPKERI